MLRLRTLISRELKITNAEADQIIGAGRVRVDGKSLAPSAKVTAIQEIILDGRLLRAASKFTYILFYKPRGIECTLNPHLPNNLLTVFDHSKRLVPVGRLDKDSEGLLLLTDDGRITKHISWNKNELEKEYLVTVNHPITIDFLTQMRNGVIIMGKRTRPAIVEEITASSTTFHIILTEGLNRQIRRMCYKLGYTVTQLIRTRIVHLVLGDLPPGKWRELTENEQKQLLELLSN